MKKVYLITLISILGMFQIKAQQMPFYSSSPITEPKLFAEGVISSIDRETGISFTPDGKMALFAKWSLDFRIVVILYSEFKDGTWTEPRIAPFSGKYRDQHSTVSPDGKYVYFVSNRPLEGHGRGFRIWRVALNDNQFSEAEPVGVNEPGRSYGTPSITLNGTLYYSAIGRGASSADIYFATTENGEFTTPQKIENETINSPEFDEWHSYISKDGNILIFTSNERTGGFGKEDLYVAYKQNNVWQDAKLLPEPVNTSEHDYLAIISPDNRYLFYSSIRKNNTFRAPEDGMQMTDYKDFLNRIRSVENDQPNFYQIDLSAAGIEFK